jgi:hypothetical protein
VSVIRQPSLFGVEASPPEPDDLAGLLLAGGRIDRTDDAAQLSIMVKHPWRAAAIVAECGRRGIPAISVSMADAYVDVRTAHAPSLLSLARSWSDDVGRRAPRALRLDARVLRLWAIAVGQCEGTAYVLPIAEPDQVLRDAVGAALARLGLAAQLVSRRGTGEPTLRIVGTRRMRRLVEMIGDPPRQAPSGMWPS